MLHDLVLTCYYLMPWLLAFSGIAGIAAAIFDRMIAKGN